MESKRGVHLNKGHKSEALFYQTSRCAIRSLLHLRKEGKQSDKNKHKTKLKSNAILIQRENRCVKAVHATQMRNSCYSHSVQDIEQMLKKNNGYVMSPQFRRMQADIESYLGIKN